MQVLRANVVLEGTCMMVVSMFHVIVEIPESFSIKDKRMVVQSIKDKLHKKYKISCAELDLLDSLRFAHIGGAYVSNSMELGNTVLQKALNFIETSFPLRIHTVEFNTEHYD